MVLFERCKNYRVKMLGLVATIAAGNDVHGLQMIDYGLVAQRAMA